MRDGSRFPETRAGGCKQSVERESHAGAERLALPLPHLHAGGGVASFATRIASLIIVLCEAIESERRRGSAAAWGGVGMTHPALLGKRKTTDTHKPKRRSHKIAT